MQITEESKPEEVEHFATTKMFKEMAAWSWANKMNRCLKPETLDFIDPEGMHLCVLVMNHHYRDGLPFQEHLRTAWLVKVTDESMPVAMILDVNKETYLRNTIPVSLFRQLEQLEDE